jgi:hypothetical protein
VEWHERKKVLCLLRSKGELASSVRAIAIDFKAAAGNLAAL